jgi:hypothetical protein
MKYLIVSCFIIAGVFSQVWGQDGDYYLTIVNSFNKTVKQVHVGDQIRIRQFNSKLYKGQVTSINEFNVSLDTNLVFLKDIEKISTKKGWVQHLGGV